MPPFDALKMARERSLDLVEISPNAVPPVCRIQDYGKFLYEKDKSERAARKKQPPKPKRTEPRGSRKPKVKKKGPGTAPRRK